MRDETLQERLRYQHARNVALHDANVKRLAKNDRFLRWFGWVPLLTEDLRYWNTRLVKADAHLVSIDQKICEMM